MSPPVMDKPVLGYKVGEIEAKAAVTSEIFVAGSNIPLQGFINHQYVDSQTMTKRPGMHMKYLPYRFDEATGQIISGGAYLFDTWENAKDYDRWTTEEFMVGDPPAKFWEQPMFESSKRLAWRVVGARNFIPIEEHAVGRFQQWTYTASDIDGILSAIYPTLRDAAERQGAASFWLLHRPEDKIVGIHLAFKKTEGDNAAAARRSLKTVENKESLASHFPSAMGTQPLLDRTSLFLTLWLPLSQAAGGSELTVPMYPVVPKIDLKANSH